MHTRFGLLSMFIVVICLLWVSASALQAYDCEHPLFLVRSVEMASNLPVEAELAILDKAFTVGNEDPIVLIGLLPGKYKVVSNKKVTLTAYYDPCAEVEAVNVILQDTGKKFNIPFTGRILWMKVTGIPPGDPPVSITVSYIL